MESESEESGCFQIVRVGSRCTSTCINESQWTFPRFVIGLVLLFLLPTPTIWFSLDHKPNISDGVVSGESVLFSVDQSDSNSNPSVVKTSLKRMDTTFGPKETIFHTFPNSMVETPL